MNVYLMAKYGTFAVLALIAAGVILVQKQREAQCRAEGHQWEDDYTGLECARCGTRA